MSTGFFVNDWGIGAVLVFGGSRVTPKQPASSATDMWTTTRFTS